MLHLLLSISAKDIIWSVIIAANIGWVIHFSRRERKVLKDEVNLDEHEKEISN